MKKTSSNQCPVRGEVVPVRMRDGIKLSVHVHRPEKPGRYPAVLMYTPYHKGPLGGHHPIVEHGYATVTFDVRGTGNSEGWNDSVYCDAERQDGYDMVEWAAAQPWCNGNVGMWGISYGAVVALQTAFAAPPHLKAIIARSGTDDIFTEWTNPGGSPRPFIHQTYSNIMTASNFCPPDPAELGRRWRKTWNDRLRRNVPWGIPFIRHLKDGPFWRARSLRGKCDRVKCAVFVVDGWADWYYTPLLRTFASVKTPKRALIGPWSHQWPDSAVPGPQIDWLHECLKWFGQWLKGEDTGVMEEPPVTVFVREYSPPAPILMTDAGKFRCENEWPIARTIHTPMYFGNDGRLLTRPAGTAGADRHEYDPLIGACAGLHGGGPFNINWAMPLDQRPDELRSLTYTTGVLRQPVEIAGRPRAVLHFSSTTDVTQFVVKLCDVAPDGTSALVTKGYLNVTHRTSSTRPSFIKPGRKYRVEIDLLACAYRFRAGHRIRVSVASADLLNVWPTPKPCTNTVYHGAGRASHIVLPVIPAPKTRLPKPALKISPRPPVRREDLEPPTFSVERDSIQETATIRYALSYGKPWPHRAAYTVSARQPANATIDSESQRTCIRNGKSIATHARCVTRSDPKSFSHEVDLTITIDGKTRFKKHWKTKVPRGWV